MGRGSQSASRSTILDLRTRGQNTTEDFVPKLVLKTETDHERRLIERYGYELPDGTFITHRGDDLPAMRITNGSVVQAFWMTEDLLDRDNGPAMVELNKEADYDVCLSAFWYRNGVIDRRPLEDGLPEKAIYANDGSWSSSNFGLYGEIGESDYEYYLARADKIWFWIGGGGLSMIQKPEQLPELPILDRLGFEGFLPKDVIASVNSF